jgi:hypothetical protein
MGTLFMLKKKEAPMGVNVTNLFCFVDDFKKKKDEVERREKGFEKKKREPGIQISEIVTITLWEKSAGYKTFKDFYCRNYKEIKEYFPLAPSYNRFIELKGRGLELFWDIMCWFMGQAERTGIYFVDATKLEVCKSKRISSHKVFEGSAQIGKSSYGWFFGYKLHLLTNHKGEIVSLSFSDGNQHDIKALPSLTDGLTGLLFGDKGYIGQTSFEELLARGLKKVTPLRQNMPETLITLKESILLRKRSIIESSIGILKRSLDLEHSRHRSRLNALVHWLSSLVSYCLRPSKPTIIIDF